ncbi:MAG: ABC transporter permease [Mycobacteriales bacterium]
MRVYWEVARSTYRRYSTYRLAMAAGLFTNIVFGFLRAYVLLALWRTRPHLGGYTSHQAVLFTFITQGLLAPIAVFGQGLALSDRIRTGDVAIDLFRPMDFQGYWLAGDLGRAAVELLGRAVVPIAVGALAFSLSLSTSPLRWLVFLTSVLLAVLVSFGVRYLVALTGFFLLDARGPQVLTLMIGSFFSGMYLPLVIFPGWLGTLARLLPWAAILQVPADLLMGTEHPAALGFQAGWAVVLLAAGRLATRAVRHRVVAQGG